MDQDQTWRAGRPRPRLHCDGNPAPHGRGTAAPTFEIYVRIRIIRGPCLLWPNGWMDHDSTWYGGRPRPRRHCVRWGPSCPQRGTAPIFGPCLLWPNECPSQLLMSTCFLLAYIVCDLVTSSLPVDSVRAVVIVWRIRGEIIITVLCRVVCYSSAQ